jgi:hypothetical protein
MLIFESDTMEEWDDRGMSLEIEVLSPDDDPEVDNGVWVLIRSWQQDKKHEVLQPLVGKRLRVTVEVLGDNEQQEPEHGADRADAAPPSTG